MPKNKTRPSPSERLQSLYDQLPHLECQQKCSAYCGIIPLSPLEAVRIRDRLGWPLGCNEHGACTALDPAGRCRVYKQRPMICRLWGLCEGMLCPFGCTPERVLTRAEAADFMQQSMQLSQEEGFHPDGSLSSLDLRHPASGRRIQTLVAVDDLLRRRRR